MKTLVWMLAGIFATWRLTHDVSSSMELYGPFGLYERARHFFNQKRLPEWMQGGAECPYCVSFWIGHMVALMLPIYGGMTRFKAMRAYLAASWAISGAVTFYYRWVVVLGLNGLDSRDV